MILKLTNKSRDLTYKFSRSASQEAYLQLERKRTSSGSVCADTPDDLLRSGVVPDNSREYVCENVFGNLSLQVSVVLCVILFVLVLGVIFMLVFLLVLLVTFMFMLVLCFPHELLNSNCHDSCYPST